MRPDSVLVGPMLPLLLLLFFQLVCVKGRLVFVAPNGEDRTDCGKSSDTACESLQGALKYAEDDDIILLDSIRGRGEYWHCIAKPLNMAVSLTIKGYRGIAQIGCPRDLGQTALFNMSSVSGGVCNITFQDLVVTNANLMLKDTNLLVKEAKLLDTMISSAEGSRAVSVQIIESEVQGSVNPNCSKEGNCEPTSLIRIMTDELTIGYHNTTFLHTKQQMVAKIGSEFVMENCLVSNVKSMFPVHGGIYLTVGAYAGSDIQVRNCHFERQINFDPIQSIRNLYEAAFMVRANKYKGDKHLPTSNVSTIIENNTFHDNERGLTFIGPFKELHIINCVFTQNIAMHAGAGILFLTSPVGNYIFPPALIINCTFDTNAAGSFRPEYVQDFQDSFQVSADEVRIHSTCCKGVISFVGKGGAIRAQRGNLTVIDCLFKNNTARLLGGAIFVDREGALSVFDSQLENTPKHIHSNQGDLIYSNGMVTIKNAKLIIQTAKNHIAMVRHSGHHWSIEVTEIFVQCPVGYRLRVTNTSSYGVQQVGLVRSYKLDQLSYFCESCPRNKYSLDYGFLNYSLVFSEFSYYTLLIDGTEQVTPYNGSYMYHDIECQECPYGGRCHSGINSVANFWGYLSGDGVKFQHCPKGYCCSETHCIGYDSCATHRDGRLCGTCEIGYSEALFSSACVPDEQCNTTFLWPFTILSGLIYTLFLLFQKDMRDMISFKATNCNDIRVGTQNATYEIDHVNHDDHVSNRPFRDLGELDHLNTESDVETDQPQENNNRKNETEDETTTNEENKDAGAASDIGASFLIILFYYFQDAQLLNVNSIFATTESRTKIMIKGILSGLFKFRLELFQFVDKFCFIKHISPSMKMLVKVVLVPYVLLQFGIMYIIYCWIRVLRPEIESKRETDDNEEAPKKTFLSKLSTGFILALLFTYQKLATTSFTLLNCVPVGDKNVLFIEGTIVCYQGWQYGVMAYTAVCIVPFCLVLLIGPGLVKDGLIGLPQFFCACLIPLPFLIYWVTLRLSLRGARPQNSTETLSAESQAVIQILQGPFKDSYSKLFGPTCGQGVLLGRRLILVILYTFVNDPLIRMLCMILVCFIILLHHVHALPYKDTKGNLAGSASAAALLVMGGINLVRACFEAAEYVPQGPNEVLMQVFKEFEDVLMLWFPMCVMICVFIVLALKLGTYILKCFLPPEPQHIRDDIHTDVTAL